MTGYFIQPSDLAAATKARSVDINTLAAAIASAFAKVPDELSLKGGSVIYAVDTGTVNAIAASVNPATVTSLYDGLSVRVRVSATNTTTTPTLNLNSLGAVGIVRRDGSAVAAGDISVGVNQFFYDGALAKWTIPNGGAQGNIGNTGATGPANVMTAIVPLSTNTTLLASHAAKLIDCTSTFTLAFSACATLGAGWVAWLRNSGIGDVTLDPNGAETIDGLTSFIMYPGEVRLVQCDGTTLRSIVIQPFARTFTSSGTFTKPPGYKYFGGMLWGAGGSGCKNSTLTYKSGGAGGGCAPFTLPVSSLGSTEVVTIGAGGAAQTVAETNGNPGGNSTLGALLTAYGGLGGVASSTANATAVASGGSAYTSSANNQNTAIASGSGFVNGYLAGAAAQYNIAGNSVYGGGAGDGFNGSTTGTPGISVFAGSGGTSSNAGTAGDGVAPSGGGGATISGTSGNGARGELRIWGEV